MSHTETKSPSLSMIGNTNRRSREGWAPLLSDYRPHRKLPSSPGTRSTAFGLKLGQAGAHCLCCRFLRLWPSNRPTLESWKVDARHVMPHLQTAPPHSTQQHTLHHSLVSSSAPRRPSYRQTSGSSTRPAILSQTA
jgi:hypothetical protein